MSDSTVALGPLLALLLIAFAAGAATIVRVAQLGRARDIVTAAARATVQLAVVSLAISGVIRHPLWTAGFITLMILIAAGTSAHRIGHSSNPRNWWTLAPIALSVLPVLGLILASTVVPTRPIAVLPIAGIIIGGAMTATSLSGRRATEELHSRRGEYDAALSIGLTRRESVHLIAKPAAALALVPVLDQTRTVGLVTLPGAFVGVLLAGASPLQAGTAQLLVLISLLLIESIATVLTIELVGAGRISGPDGPLPQ